LRTADRESHEGGLVRRKLLNGVLGGLAALGALYAFGVIGLLTERLTGQPVVNCVIAFLGLGLAVSLGILVLRRLSRLTDPSLSPVNRDSATNTEQKR
jgi:hypothetical protein